MEGSGVTGPAIRNETLYASELDGVLSAHPRHVLSGVVDRNDAPESRCQPHRVADTEKLYRGCILKSAVLAPLPREAVAETADETGRKHRVVARGNTLAVLEIDAGRLLAWKLRSGNIPVILKISTQKEHVLSAVARRVVKPRYVCVPAQRTWRDEPESCRIETVSDRRCIRQRIRAKDPEYIRIYANTGRIDAANVCCGHLCDASAGRFVPDNSVPQRFRRHGALDCRFLRVAPPLVVEEIEQAILPDRAARRGAEGISDQLRSRNSRLSGIVQE
jgi:hypothetical protein